MDSILTALIKEYVYIFYKIFMCIEIDKIVVLKYILRNENRLYFIDILCSSKVMKGKLYCHFPLRKKEITLKVKYFSNNIQINDIFFEIIQNK